MGTRVLDPICAALFPRARCEILRLLFGHPDRSYYLREIVKKTGLGVGHVQRELERLHQGGLISRSRIGRHIHFQAERSSPVFEELRALVTRTIGAVAVLRQALAPISERIVVAFVFGSVANGQERAESDLDLMVVGDASFAEVVEVIRGAELDTGREINPTVYPLQEFRTKFSDGHHFLNSVVKREKLFVMGTEDELETILGQ